MRPHQQATYYLHPEEYAERAGVTIHEVWRQLERGDLTALAACEWSDKPFDYWLINDEAVRAIIAGQDVDYDPGYGGIRRIRGDKALIRVLIDPSLTPWLFKNASVTTSSKEKPQTSNLAKKAWDLGRQWMLAEEKKHGTRPINDEIARFLESEFKRLDLRGDRDDYLDWQSIKKFIVGITERKKGHNFARNPAKKPPKM